MPQSVTPGSWASTTTRSDFDISIVRIDHNVLKTLNQRSANPAPDPRLSTSNSWEYRIGHGDVLSIVVWDHPQLTIPAGPQRTPQEAGNWVSTSGTIFYPYIGTLSVAGKTIEDVRQAVTTGLRNVIPNPQVDVTIAKFGSQKVMVTGEVGAAGAVPVTNIPLSLLDAIDARQGVLEYADLRRVRLIRGTDEIVIDLQEFLSTGRAAFNPLLQGGDVIVVPRLQDNEVYVLGEVKRPRVVPLFNRTLSLASAIAGSDGVNRDTADARGVFVFRAMANQQGILVYQLDTKDPTALLLGSRFTLQQGDVVYVTSAPAARWNRLIRNIVPSLGAVNTLLLIEDRS